MSLQGLVNEDPDGLTNSDGVHENLECLDFSVGGLRLGGSPPAERFLILVTLPHSGACIPATVELVHQRRDSFGVKFVQPSKELVVGLGLLLQAYIEVPSRTLGGGLLPLITRIG